ncbi:lactate utilization protein [Thalassospira sp. MA62]|nr:lactate utilization protein [Thalassospira sp. MA62]
MGVVAKSARKRQYAANIRTFPWVIGPARTCNIEQAMWIGAYGPRRLHIVLVDDTEKTA